MTQRWSSPVKGKMYATTPATRGKTGLRRRTGRFAAWPDINPREDGLFHAATYVFVLIGLALLWRAGSRQHPAWSGKLLAGTLLLGFGAFNTVEGLSDHQALGIHHVNETVPRAQWLAWDLGFLAWGVAMLGGGWLLLRAGRRETTQGRVP